MSTTTTTGTLTAGSSKTFNLAPGSALSLTLSPNPRVTITETPESVSGSGVGGNTTRVHEPQLPGTFAYGPYAMGGVVVVAVASYSGSSVAWTRKDTVVTTSSDGTSLVSGDGTVLIPVVGGMSTEATAAIATANTNKLQAALAAGGLVQVLAPGTYYLDPLQSLVMPSKTKLALGAGVSLVSRTGRICPVIRNKYSGNVIAGPQFVRASNVVTVSEAGHTKAVGDLVFVKAVSSSGTDSSFIATVTVLSVVAGVSWTYASTGSNGTAGAATVFYGLIPVRQQLAGSAMTATSFYVLVTEAGHDKRPGMNVWIGKDGGDNFAPGIVRVTKTTADTWTYATSAASGTASGTFSLSYDYDIEIDGGSIDGNRAGLGSIASGSEAMGSATWFGNVTNLRINSRIGGSNFRGIQANNCADVLLDKMWSPFDCLVGAQFEGGAVGVVVDQAVSGNDAWSTTSAQKADDFVAFTGTACVGGGGNYDNTCSAYGLTFFDGIDVRSINATGALNGVKVTSTGASCPFRGVLRIGRVFARELDNLPQLTMAAMLKVFDDGPGLVGTVFDTIQIDGPITWNGPANSDGIVYVSGAGTGNIIRGRGLQSETSQVNCIKFANTFVLGLLDIDASRFTALGTNNPQVNMSGGTVRKMMVRNSTIVVGTAQPFVTFSGGVLNHLAFENCQLSGVSSGTGDVVDYALASAALNVLSFKGCRTPTSGTGFNSLCVFGSGIAIPALDITLDDHDVTSASGIRTNDATCTGTVNIYLGAKVKWTATGGNNFIQGGGTSSMFFNLWGDSGNRNSLPATKVFLTGFGTPVYKSIGFTQVVASSATPALRCGLGNNVTFTATAASLWGAPTEIPPAGTPVTITITQDGTGGWAITWNAAYIFPTAWSNTGNTAGKKSVASFISDGTSLVAQGGNVWY